MIRARSPISPDWPCSWSIRCSASEAAAYSTRSKSNPSSLAPDVTTSEKLSVSKASAVQSISSGRSSSAAPWMRSSAPGSSSASSPSPSSPEATAAGASGSSSLPDSSNGFFESSSAMKASSSRLLSWRSWIAWRSCGVRTSCCDWRMDRLGPNPMGAGATARSSRRGRGAGPPGRRLTLREYPGTGPDHRR